MPTLDELIGQNAIRQGNTLDDYFDTSEVGPSVPDFSMFDEPQDVPYLDRSDRNAALDFLGQGLWSFLDTAAFSVPSLLAPKDLEEKYLTPETAPGRVGAAIGGTVGFIAGAPMKIGAKAVKVVAKPFIKKAGKETVEQIVKKSAAQVAQKSHHAQFSSKAGANIMNKEIGKRLSHIAHKTRWDIARKGVADNWGKTASKAIDDIVADGVKLGNLTAKEARLIATTFKKNIGTRPMQDFVDLMMKRYPNKWGWLAGNMINEGAMFGMIDAAMEVSHSLNEDRPYDFMAPLWGVGIGSAFGALKLLPAAGKQSITGEDFRSGARALLSRNHYKTMGSSKLVGNAHIIGKMKAYNGESTVISHKGMEIDLLNPLSSIMSSAGVSKTQASVILREVLNGQRVKYGTEMMKSALTEDFKSSLANWKRVIGGTAIMNTRMMMELSHGAEMEPEDIATSLLIGAFINRKGRPLTPEMNMKKMGEIRRNLHLLGEPQTRMFDVFPTLGKSQFEHINPITTEGFKGLRKKSEELELVGDVPEKVETMREDGSPSLAASEKSFPLFNEYYSWLSGASGKRYIKPKALITEKEAESVEAEILKLEFEGNKVNSVKDFEDMLIASTERITDNVEYEIAKSLNESLKPLNWITNNPSHGTLGDLPETIIISQSLKNAVERGEISYSGDAAPLSAERMHESIRKINKLIEINGNIMKGEVTQNPNNKVVEIKTAEQLRQVMDSIVAGEGRINKLFNTGKESLKFDFDSLDSIQFQMLARKFAKSTESMSKFFSDVDNPKWDELMNVLYDAGVVSRDPENLGRFRLNDFNKIRVEKEEGFKGDKEESILKSVIGILGARGNKSLPVDTSPKEVVITQEQVGRLEQYLNQNKIATQKELLDMFRVNITQKIFSDIMKDTKINTRDVAILSDLSNLGVPMARYSTMADGGVGFTISKVDIIGNKQGPHGKLVNDYNNFVDNLIQRGTSKTGQFVKADRTVIMLDPNDVKVLRSIIARREAAEGQRAAESLVDFVKALDPQDNIRAGIITWLEKSNRPDDLLNFMLGEGLITTKAKKGVIQYVFNQKEFSSDASRQKVADWLSRFGVHTTDIDKMMSAAEVEIDSFLDAKHKGHEGTFSQQKFFSDWFPDPAGFGSSFNEAETQNQMLNDAIYRKNGSLRSTPHDNIISQMSVKVGEQMISGKELLTNKKQYRNQYNRIFDDVQKMVALRHGTVSKPVLSVSQGNVKVTNKNMQKGPFTSLFDELKIPYTFVDGEMYAFHYADNAVKSRSINVLDLDSPHSTSGFDKNAPTVAGNLRNAFEKVLNTYQFEGEAGEGVALIRLGNAKHVVGVPKTSFAKIADLFNSRIYDKYYDKASDATKEQMEKMRVDLEQSGTWGPVHEDAMRSIIIESMTKGKNDVRFLDYVEGGPEVLADLGKRFSLFHTPAFKRMDKELFPSLSKNAPTSEDAKLISDFSARDLGFIVWNDKSMASVKGRTEKLLADKQTSWEQMLGARQDESSFDSITFISKDYKRLLELYYGVSQRGSNVFKPIISSNGEDHLMYAKTVFVYDPDIQAEIFSKKKGLDVLMTRSADKLKSSISEQEWADAGKPDRPVYINKTVDEMLNITSQEITEKMRTIPLSKVGVSIIPDNQMRARQSYSIPNYMNTAESGEYYSAFYSSRLDKLLGVNTESPGIMEKLIKDSMYKRLALLKLKNIDPNVRLADLQATPEGLEGVGHQLQWAALGGDPRAMGENVLINTIKSQFLDPILSPYSETDVGELYGGKAVIKQNFKFRDLDPTIRTGETRGDTKVYPGEIMLPEHIRDGAINFGGKDINLKAIDKNGNAQDVEKVFFDLIRKRDIKLNKKRTLVDSDIKDDIKFMMENGNLGELHDMLKSIDPNWSLGVLTTRYPRTSPNDLAVLRLRGFLAKEEGNTAIVNDFDVLNIFEGDYDVDEVDFFWGMNKGTWSHVDRQKQHWVNTKNPDHYKPKTPDLRILDRGLSNSEWNTFDANNRTFKRGIGVVQKNVRLVNHLANLGVKAQDGMNNLMMLADGSRIAVDYDNTSFFERQALESQLIIDYWKGVHPDIVNKMTGYRNESLFPTIDKSISKEEVSSLQERQQSHLALGPENRRIRIFRKFNKEGKEIELSAIDKTILQTLMAEHSKLLTLGTEVYDGSGQSRPPTYQDLMDVSRNYFDGHMNDITTKVFLAVRRQHGDTKEFKDMFNVTFKVRKDVQRRLDRLYGQQKTDLMAEIQNEIGTNTPGKNTYLWYKKSPFLDGVIANGKETQRSGGAHGSVVERIYREILHRDPLGDDGRGGKSDVLLQGEMYNEMQSAASEIMSKDVIFGENPVERMKSILPRVIGKVNEDIKQIKYLKKVKTSLIKNKELPYKTKEKRILALDNIIKEREAGLKDLMPTKYLETGDVKYLKSLKLVDISRDKDMEEGTVQWYSLYEMVERYRPDRNLKQFGQAVSDVRKLGAELYSEFNELGSSTPYKNMSLIKEETALKRQAPNDSIKDIETKIMEKLNEGYNEYQMPFLFEYAMPTRDDGTVIGVFNGNPMPVSTKPSGRFKRTIRFLFDKHNTTKNKEEKLAIKEALEILAQRYTAYRNFFDSNYGLIPLKDQDVLGILNNVPGFNKKIKSTFDRYETINIEKGIFSRDVFGMGPEYDSSVSFYRRLIADAFGSQSRNLMRFKDLESSLSYTNQLVMENNYMNPISYFLMTEKVRNDLNSMGLDKAVQVGLEGNQGNTFSAHATSPELAVLAGRGDGVSIKPISILGDYRLNMLKKFIKQGRQIKENQKRSVNWEEMKQEDVKAGYCNPSKY